MSLEVTLWKIEDVLKVWEKIDPKPQYQRSPVWNEKRKKLLIDSIFSEYDIPKFYFNKLNQNQFFDYEVADGQQRLRAIHEFYNNEFSALKVQTENQCYNNINYEDLDEDSKSKFLNYSLTITILIDVSTEKVREIFSRLQMGVGLNQAELRRAIASNISFYVQSIIENHTFFDNCGIKDSRNKHQDYIDHCVGYLHNGFKKDLKGINLREVYIDLSAADLSQLTTHITKILSLMEKVNTYKKGIFKNKWAFVDTFIFLHKNLNFNRKFNPKKYFELFSAFESERLINGKKPEELLEKNEPTEHDKRLYNYILAFKTGGALKNNLLTRSKIFDLEFKDAIK